MDNQTYPEYFHILAFSIHRGTPSLLGLAFLFIYLIAILGNFIIITLVCFDTHLHTPMYLFIGNLSFVDICFITVTIPKLIDILLTGNNSISFVHCFSQLYFLIFLSATEILLLSSMAYDRYVAICNPLHYHLVMNKKKCLLLLGVTWIAGCQNSLMYTVLASKEPLCHSNEIHHFYCDGKAMAKISCVETRFRIILFFETLVFGFFPFLLTLFSYVKIISTIMHIKTTEGRGKSFSTCTSHLTVIIIFYGTILSVYMGSPTENSQNIDEVFTLLYAAVTPMLNPLIYSLRNKEVKSALMRTMSLKSKTIKLIH